MYKLKTIIIALTVALLSTYSLGATAVINSFNAGELSPLLEGRTDIKAYYRGCRTLENMVVMAQGGVTKRPGSYYIAAAKSSSDVCRLISFEYSSVQAYIIEIGDEYMRFYKDGGQILDSNDDPYEISTDYDIDDVFEIQFIQSADTMYLVHGDYPPASLIRTGHTSWTLADVDFERGPFLPENETTTTITPSATTGTITLTASAALFNANHVGALWQTTHTVAATNTTGSLTTADTNSTDLTIQLGRSYDFTTHGTWDGIVLLQRSYDTGTTWKDVTSFSSADDGNISYSDSEAVDDAIYRVYMKARTSGTCEYDLVARSFDVDGVVDITAYTSTTVVTGTVDVTLGGISAVTTWAEGAWSPDEGYPSCIAFYEERQVFAATDNKPQTLWFSQTDDWTNFLIGSDDTDAITLTIASDQVNVIRWLVPQTALLIGTLGGEWTLSASAADEPLTPTNVAAKRQSSYGSAAIQATAVNNQVIFTQRQLRKIRKLQYSFELDNWIAPDLTLLSEHITESGVIQVALQRNPNPILWACLTDGMLIGLTLEESHEVIGWHRHDLDGDVESIAIIPGDGEDEVWMSVERTITTVGSTVRYIEQLQPFDWGDDQEDAFFVDSGLTFDGGASVTITGITRGEPAVVAAASHGFSDGDQVRISGVSGMIEINDKVYTVDDAATNTFSLDDYAEVGDINSIGFTAYISGGSAVQVENTFTTLSHLNTETVTIAADGGYYGTDTVSSDTITLDDYFNTVHIGIGYTAKLQPMKLEMSTSPGSLFGQVKRITEVTIRFYETLGCKIGPSWTDYDSYIFRDTSDLLEAPPPLYTEDKTIEFTGDYEKAGNIYIQHDLPLPLTILALMSEFEVHP